jgi:pectinesterase
MMRTFSVSLVGRWSLGMAVPAVACAVLSASVSAETADTTARESGISDRKPTLIVASDGSGDVKTVGEAINRVPENNTKRFVIFIKPGIYNEQIVIGPRKPFVSLLGEKAEETKLTFKVKVTDADLPWPACAVDIEANDFYAENITFENSFGGGVQAMAVVTKADRIVFRNCRFLGWQDTLFARAGRQYFDNCYIEGDTDFICGQASAVFENCTLHSKRNGYIAAPLRFSATEPSGFVFIRCHITGPKTRNGVFLGRPWGPYGRAIYIESEIGAHIRPEGWANWNDTTNFKTAYFSEFNCTGPGANGPARVKWAQHLTADEAKQFETENFLKGGDNWNPKQAGEVWLEKNPPP